MSARILTVAEARKTQASCQKYGEYFSGQLGKAKKTYVCDNSGEKIPKGEYCVWAVVLPSKDHFNREHQEAMAKESLDLA